MTAAQRLLLGLVAWLVVFLLLALLLIGCHPADDSGTDGRVDNRCAELDNPPPGCEP